MFRKKYSHNNDGQSKDSSIPYELVDCNSDQKLTKDIEKLLTLSEEEVKAYLCK